MILGFCVVKSNNINVEKMNEFEQKETNKYLSGQNANSTNLVGQHQKQGRLTAILPTPFRLKAYNYVYWLVACDHGDLELRKFINENIGAIAAESQDSINLLIELISSAKEIENYESFGNLMLPKLYHVEKNNLNIKKRNYKRKVFRVSAISEIKKIDKILNLKTSSSNLANPENNFLFPIDYTSSIESTVKSKSYKGGKEGFKLCLINSAGFINETTASCGCLKARSDSYLIVKPSKRSKSLESSSDKKILVSLNEISGLNGVNQTTIKNRIINDPHLTLWEAIKGNSNRHVKSKTQAYPKAKAINRFVIQTKKTFDEISVYSRLTPQEMFVIYCRLFKNDKMSLQQIADTEYMCSSREWVRQVEHEGLRKICNAYEIDFGV